MYGSILAQAIKYRGKEAAHSSGRRGERMALGLATGSQLDILSRRSIRLTRGRVTRARPLHYVPRLSVVIPCYNYGRYLRQCVESVTRDQPGIQVEVIIVDDKSTDDSLGVALSLQDCDTRVRVIQHEQNKGHIETYNEGLDAATGEFILLLSADDLVTPGALTRAAALLAAEPSVGLVYGNCIDFSGNLPVSRSEPGEWAIWPGAEWLHERCRSAYNVVPTPTAVMRTSVLRAIGGYRADLPHAGDYEMWLRTSAVSDIGFLLNVDQGYYRLHASNMHKKDFSSGSAKGQLIDLTQIWQSFEAVFAGVGEKVDADRSLLRIARETLARSALEHVNYAYARGFQDFPADEFEALAYEIDPDVGRSAAARALARRKKIGMISLPIHPLWVFRALSARLKVPLRHWRRRRIGI
jgi:glycosyltransferase involved in cell wall biosynthesis